MRKIAIVGYGNLGKACENIVCAHSDMTPVGVFTRRDPYLLSSPFGTSFYRQEELADIKDDIDVVLICTGSANDVEQTGCMLAARFNTVDSFDTHAKIPSYLRRMNDVANEHDRLCFVSIGWDPGVFSLTRALFNGIMLGAQCQTFWGRGVSQGHSEAIRRIDGVEDAKQYTVPIAAAVNMAYEGNGADLTDRQKHRRECYVVAKPDADKELIRQKIVNMPNYFEPYDTEVHFISKEELINEHSSMGHAGKVIGVGDYNGCKSKIELSLKLDSNPYFTASVMVAYAQANIRMYENGARGALTMPEIPVSALFGGDRENFIRSFV